MAVYNVDKIEEKIRKYSKNKNLIKKRYREDCKISMSSHLSAKQIMDIIVETYNINYDEFIEKTYLGRSTYYNLRNAKGKNYMTTIVAFAVAFKISLSNIETLLQAFGLGFDKSNNVHNAYIELIERYSGNDIIVCNYLLKLMDIDEKYWLPTGDEDCKLYFEELEEELQKNL